MEAKKRINCFELYHILIDKQIFKVFLLEESEHPSRLNTCQCLIKIIQKVFYILDAHR